MMGLSTAKLIGAGVGLLLLVGLVLGLRHYKSLAESRGEKLAVICQTTRDASGSKRLSCGDVPKQITLMGGSILNLKAGIARQNQAVAALGAETARQQAESARASRTAVERARRPEATAERLTASSRAGERQAKPCEPSKALKESWR